MKFFTSDTHFGHENIIRLSHRPFDSLDEMHNTIITNWNKTVKHDDDIVYVLGDFTSEGGTGVGLELARQLRGRKRLVEGNHDKCWMGKSTGVKDRLRFGYDDVFELISPWMREKIDGVKVVMSHFPYSGDHTEGDRFEGWRLRTTTTPLIHGHVHSPNKVTTVPIWTGDAVVNLVKQIHVGVDAWNFTPVSERQITELLHA